MGRAIPPAAKHESTKQARRRVRYEALLDAVELATGIIATISDGVLSVPGLKSTVALVNQIVVVAKVGTFRPPVATLLLTVSSRISGSQCQP